MDRGHRSAGRKMPKTPGSTDVLESRRANGRRLRVRYLTRRRRAYSRPSETRVAFPVMAEIRHQRTIHTESTSANPRTQTQKSKGESRAKRAGDAAGIATGPDSGKDLVNG